MDGVIIHKYGRKANILEVYNNSMHLKWKKEIELTAPDAFIEEIYMYDNSFIVVFLSERKNITALMAVKLNRDFKPVINEMVLDTIEGSGDDIAFHTRVIISDNREQVLVFRTVPESGNNNEVQLIAFNKDLRVAYNKTLSLSPGEEKVEIRAAAVDNRGNAYLLSRIDNGGRKRNEVKPSYSIVSYNRESNRQAVHRLDFPAPAFGIPYIQLDNANNNILVSGFFADDEDKAARGFYYKVVDAETNKTTDEQFTKFPAELVYRITGKDTTENESILYSFEIKDMIPRYDGGAIVVAESSFDNSESIEMPSFAPSATPSFRTVRITYFNDILVFSINPDATTDWYSILRKKQVSEDDDGFYSSYCFALARDRLNFIYNEEVYFKTNVNTYAVNHAGNVERISLFNAGNENVMLVPRLGKQVSSNEVVIPSYKRNNLSFVKFTY